MKWKEWELKEQVFKHIILIAIQEMITGFINDHVIPEDGEFHHNPRLNLKSPNKNEHLYEL
jgi:hypothetical protein